MKKKNLLFKLVDKISKEGFKISFIKELSFHIIRYTLHFYEA